MITGSMSRFPPPPVAEGPRPKMWKSLGVVAQDQRGYVEALYELKTFRGDLDPDSEDDIRGATQGLLGAISTTGRPLDNDDIYVLQRRSGFLKVRLVVGYWGVATTVPGRM